MKVQKAIITEALADAEVGVVMSARKCCHMEGTRRLTFDAVGMAFMLCPSSQ